MTSAQLLDRVQTLAAVDALDANEYATLLAAELPQVASLADLEARDAQLAAALAAIDATIQRVMRIRLEHVADMLPAPTRRVFATTIASYANQLALLGDRVRDVATRSRLPDPSGLADAVVEAARTTLASREALAGCVLALIARLAAAAMPDANARARSRDLDDAQRKRWSAARRELEALAADPARAATAPFATRLAAWPEQLDEPEPGAEVTFADMIELD